MICQICGKEGAREDLITDTIGEGDDLLIVENVPLVSCPNCGESYYTAKTLHQMEKARRNRTGAVRKTFEVAQLDDA